MTELADKTLLQQVVYRNEQVSLASADILSYEAVLNRYFPPEQTDGASKQKYTRWVNARLSMIRGEGNIDLLTAFQLPVVATPLLQVDRMRYAHFLRVQRVQNMAFDYCSEGLWECLSFKDYMADLMGDEM